VLLYYFLKGFKAKGDRFKAKGDRFKAKGDPPYNFLVQVYDNKYNPTNA